MHKLKKNIGHYALLIYDRKLLLQVKVGFVQLSISDSLFFDLLQGENDWFLNTFFLKLWNKSFFLGDYLNKNLKNNTSKNLLWILNLQGLKIVFDMWAKDGRSYPSFKSMLAIGR